MISFFNYLQQRKRDSTRFQFYVKVYQHKSFISSTLFQVEDHVSIKKHFTLSGQVQWITQGLRYHIQDSDRRNHYYLSPLCGSNLKKTQKDAPGWVESLVLYTRYLFIFASRGKVQCRLPILRSYPLVPQRKLVSFFFQLFFISGFLFYDTSNKPLSRSQTRRPDPFQVSAVEAWTSCILQHTPLLISDGLYQQLNYSLYVVTSLAFIGMLEDLERSVTLQQILFIY